MALSGIEAPSMKWTGENLREEWRRFKQHVELMFSGPLKSRSEAEKCSYLLIWIGQKGRDIHNTWSNITEEEKGKLQTYYERFEQHVNPRSNIVFARYKFHKRVQSPTESVEQFVTDLQKLAGDCEFKEIDEMIRDRIVIGICAEKIREKLFEEGSSLSLEKAISIARSYEMSQKELKAMANDIKEESVHFIRKSKQQINQNIQPRQNSQVPRRVSSANRKPTQEARNDNRSPQETQNQCDNCGRNHGTRDRCPARGKICKYCKKQGHFVQVCRAKRANRQFHSLQSPNTSNGLQPNFESVHFETVQIESMDQSPCETSEVYATLDVKITRGNTTQQPANCTLKVKIDTGAQGNVLPLRVYRKMFPQHIDRNGAPRSGALVPSSNILVAYGGTRIKQLGIVPIPCTYKTKEVEANFYVTDTPGPAILGLATSTALNLLSFNLEIKEKKHNYTTLPSTLQSQPSTRIQGKEHLITEYPDCFDGIGKFKGEYHITLDPTVPPVVHPPRRVPISLKEDVKKELDEMIDKDIITKINEGEPTAWVNSLVYRRKSNGRLRLCLDPKDLNEAILREHHPTSTLEEILPKLTGAKLFSIVDVKCGYWNVVLDKESSYLTTFNSPYGRYRFNRMPFGLKMSQDIFQTRIDQTFEGCRGVIGIADDIVIFGESEEDHDANMHGMMKRCRESGIKLNPDKCFIKKDSIKFYGIICGPDGIKPDPDKVSVLQQMNPPTSKQELQTFLGLANYMSPFIPCLSTLTAPLRELVKQSSVFTWNATYQEALDKIKSSITNEITLTYFDPKKETVLQVDASLKGLGAALLQDNKPIAFASKALNDVESRYANIERELLAVVYGCERFHSYLFGRPFTVQSDHKPLESIHLKHLTSAPPRLQRMLLRLQPYNLKIQFRPGRQMEIADALSRLSPEEKYVIPDMNVEIHQVCPQFSNNMLDRIRVSTSNDDELNVLKEQVYQGWPTTIKEVPLILKPYWSYRDEVTIEDGIMFKGHRVIIPKALQPEILLKLHESHQGAEKTKLRARSSVFWRDINKDIVNITKSCETCQELQNSQQKEPLIQTEVPPRAWHTVATDLFYLEGEEYLLIADYYSKYTFVRKLPKQCSSKKVVELTKEIFSEQGIPRIVRSDNGPHYDSYAFKEFAEQYGFHHVTSSPHYARSNGFIEAQVKSAKTTLKKALSTRADPYMAMLNLRSTPIDCKLPSPAEILLGRPIQDNLPRKIHRSLTCPEVTERLLHRQEQQKFYHDRSCKVLPQLFPNQKVTIQDPSTRTWKPATIQSKVDGVPRSYTVTNEAGRTLRRNRSHIREVPESTEVEHESAQSLSTEPAEISQTQDNTTTVTRTGRVVKPPSRYGFTEH